MSSLEVEKALRQERIYAGVSAERECNFTCVLYLAVPAEKKVCVDHKPRLSDRRESVRETLANDPHGARRCDRAPCHADAFQKRFPKESSSPGRDDRAARGCVM